MVKFVGQFKLADQFLQIIPIKFFACDNIESFDEKQLLIVIKKPRIEFWIAILLIILLLICCFPFVSAADVNVTPNTTPLITIDPITDHVIGDVFFINGTTNLPVTKKLRAAFQRYTDLGPTMKGQTKKFFILPDIPISPGTATINRWSVNATDFVAENLVSREYIFWIMSDETLASSDKFSIFAPKNLTNPNVQTVSSSSSSNPVTTSIVLETSAKQSSSPSSLVLVLAILGVIFLSFHYRRKRD